MHDQTARRQHASLTLVFDLAHPPARVWRALTEPALMSQWLLSVAQLDLRQGAAFTLQAPPQPGWDGTVQCRFVEIEALRRLSYSWVVGQLDTVVTFTLHPTASGTRLTVHQTGFQDHQKPNFGGARYGWKLMGGRLIDLLAHASEGDA